MLNFGRGRASLISDLDASRRSSSRSKYRPEYSKPSLLLVLIPTWFCCVVVLTAYMQCLHHYRHHGNSTSLSASDPSEALRRSEIVANNESSMPPLSPVVPTHDVQLSRHDRVYDPPLDPKLIIAPEITFTPSFHGVQVSLWAYVFVCLSMSSSITSLSGLRSHLAGHRPPAQDHRRVMGDAANRRPPGHLRKGVVSHHHHRHVVLTRKDSSSNIQ